MQEKLTKLTEEFNQGLREIELLDQRRSQLRDQLLRISGAIQALRELDESSTAEGAGKPLNEVPSVSLAQPQHVA